MNNPNCFGFEPNDIQNSTAQLAAAQHEHLELLRQRIDRSGTRFNSVDGDRFGQHMDANVPDLDGTTIFRAIVIPHDD
ncbi:hypothetical protein TSUD_191370 [Trifolium subterraneum]|uniref:Uncharacterized protein n=1 Tax=Trifolium subterraneum TaxID=3900 RepID=A0A2Z6PH16_TRISU|nr:hypothetical protein TSUD_191370 [Trifolium subterraneum]